MVIINLITIPFCELQESVEKGQITEAALLNMLQNFKCEREPVIENFVRKSIFQAEAKRDSRSYFILDEDQEELCAVGFYCLKINTFCIKKDVSGKEADRLGLKDKLQPYLPTYYIALLAKSDTYKNDVEGKLLLESAIGNIIEVIWQVGGRAVWVEAKKKNQKVVDFYTNNGFKEFQVETQEDGDYSHLLRVIKPEPRLNNV